MRSLAALAVASFSFAATAVAHPLADFTGIWVGSGSITHQGGQNEKVTCRMVYTPAGESMNVTIRCSRQDGRFEATATLNQMGSAISGSWSVSGYNADGTLRGTRNGNALALSVSGAFAGSLSVSVTGNVQSMSFTPSSSSEFTRLVATMRK